jgi:LDH2 family malate/lactate/ureidoglycolate dehydrogenase
MDGLGQVRAGSAVHPDALQASCVAILEAVGVDVQVAEVVARSLVTAEARGKSSHGIARLPTYVRRVKEKLIDPNAPPRVVTEGPATAVIDGGSGFGHYIGLRAMSIAVEKARTSGLGAVSVRNSTHFGIAALFAESAGREGYIGIATSNGPAWMAPPGTSTRILGTNPIAIAVPGAPGSAFVLDMATSVAALGKILALRDAKQPIPAGWALAPDGTPTTDSAVAADGLLLPFAGHKGFGLALVLEVLSAVLSGASVGQSAGSMYRSWDAPEGLGHFFLALSVEAFRARASYEEWLSELVEQVRSAEALDPTARVFLPGEIEAQRQLKAYEQGIRIERELEIALRRSAEAAGLTEFGVV